MLYFKIFVVFYGSVSVIFADTSQWWTTICIIFLFEQRGIYKNDLCVYDEINFKWVLSFYLNKGEYIKKIVNLDEYMLTLSC